MVVAQVPVCPSSHHCFIHVRGADGSGGDAAGRDARRPVAAQGAGAARRAVQRPGRRLPRRALRALRPRRLHPLPRRRRVALRGTSVRRLVYKASHVGSAGAASSIKLITLHSRFAGVALPHERGRQPGPGGRVRLQQQRPPRARLRRRRLRPPRRRHVRGARLHAGRRRRPGLHLPRHGRRPGPPARRVHRRRAHLADRLPLLPHVVTN